MKKIDFDRSGGAEVHFKKSKHKVPKLIGLVILTILLYSSSAFAQGSIFGTVTNSDATVPANGEISFFGYLDDTDEEIRIETCTGAGYDNGNWFDDFQNYLTEAPGNPYDYHFFNIANGEGYVLSDIIPSNSFQQENIQLASVSWPARPLGLNGRVVSGSSVVINWNAIGGLTYHVYRRMASSNGSFFRIDDPTGSLLNHGVAGNYVIDNNVDGTSSYHYMIIAEDASGNFSQHSDIITVNSAIISPPVIISISPNSGTMLGGTAVTVSGYGFDMAGATVNIGSALLTSSIVVSPNEITGLTPPSASAGPVDVWVTNAASGVSSAPLTGGYEYLLNASPILNPIGPQVTTEGVNLNFTVTASDPDATIPSLFTSALPGTATFVDNGDGTGSFDWTPSYIDAGLYQVTFYAADVADTVFEVVDITVSEAGNQPPVLDSIGPKTIAEGGNLNFIITASDADQDSVWLSATGVPAGATFVDNLDGTGTFDWTTTFTDFGTYSVTFKAFDGTEVDSEVVQIDVVNVNRIPVLAAIGPQATDENVNLNFAVTATDADGDSLILYTSALPGGAVFTDNFDGTGTFDWTPGYADAGTYDVTFYASDELDIDSEVVSITVNDLGNQPPVLDSIGAMTVVEGGSLIRNITAYDPDGDPLQLFADSLPLNAVFYDSANGVGTFTFNPDFTQAGAHNVLFYASDGILADSELVQVTVTESGNQPPVMSGIGDTTINEGDSLVVIVTAYDPDGSGVQLSATSTLPSFNFVDSGNGTGVFRFGATYYDAGEDTIWFAAVDFYNPPGVSIGTMALTITEINQPPVIDSIGPFGVVVGDNLTFNVTASDPTDPVTTHRLFLSAVGQPYNSTFTDNADNTGTFSFYPDSSQVGTVSVTFVATDMGTPQLADNFTVNITVVTENRPPVWDLPPFSPLFVQEGETIEVHVIASDPDGGIPQLYASKAPENAVFVDSGNGAGLLTFTPSFVQAGLYEITLIAYDGIDDTKAQFIVQVGEAGNQEPVVGPFPPDSVVEGETLTAIYTASDPDGTIPALYADSLPENATFTDNGDGTGTLEFTPTYIQSGTHYFYIIADDGEYTDTTIATIEVIEAGNQPPELQPVTIDPVDEGSLLTFTITATDPDMNVPYLSIGSYIPEGATFVDNRDYTGTFSWPTDYYDAGGYSIWLFATDSLDPGLIDSMMVSFVVNDVNQVPKIQVSTDHINMNEGDTATMLVEAMDPDGTIPIIDLDEGYQYAPFMTFEDFGDGTGRLTCTPAYDLVSPSEFFLDFYLKWVAIDSEDETLQGKTFQVTVTVNHVNAPPVIEPVSDTAITEGDTLAVEISASDADGTLPILHASNLPVNATFAGSVSNTKTLTFAPDYTQAGDYTVDIYAYDSTRTPVLTDTLILNIAVLEAGNQAPVFTDTMPSEQIVLLGESVTDYLRALDPDLDPVTISIDTIPDNASFIDSGNGGAVFTFSPDVTQVANTYTLTFTAADPSGAADTMIAAYRVWTFLRGDANSDGELSMLDIMYIVNYLYRSGIPFT
jgi:hypothetical protein